VFAAFDVQRAVFGRRRVFAAFDVQTWLSAGLLAAAAVSSA